ncbi:MAG TPA: HupE/UreJ family protein [Burkholderiaceae bacterium]|jgi:urease accessory protein|nr:HupE/UreJ family protein [Burkholderiaceae bacterium]
MIRTPVPFKAPVAALLTLGAAPALAHHPMGGALPATAWQGLASGLGHPVIEVDHLLFLLGAAAVAALTRAAPARAGAALILYALAASLGTLARVGEISLPTGGPAVALSLLAVAICLWLQRGPSGIAGGMTAAAAGLIHGHAYGEAVIGAQVAPLAWYLAGLVIVQSVLMIGCFAGLRRLGDFAASRTVTVARSLGAVIGAAGLTLLWAGA